MAETAYEQAIDLDLELEMLQVERQVLAETPPVQYQFVDTLPEVAQARQAERTAAQTILAERRHRQEQGIEAMQAPVDPLSTARKVREASDEASRQELQKGLQLDCQRLVAEWYRKKKPEYFPAVRHVFDETTEEFFSHGLSIRQMTENALMPIRGNQEEEQRRINERVEDATPQLLRSLGSFALNGAAVRTISECSDTAIQAYEQDQLEGNEHQGYFGYVPEIQKLMIRDIRLDETSNDRFEEQIGLPGTFITHEIIQMTLAECGVEAEHLNKTELHGSQLLVHDSLMQFVEHLDRVATREWCTEVFMGEEVSEGIRKDYGNFRQEALQRQDGLVELADKVATFVQHLDEENVERSESLQLVEDYVKLELGEMGKSDLTLAEEMFDTKTAQGLQEVRLLELAGKQEEAAQRFSDIMRQAPGGGFCGAGSCGLEGFNEVGEKAERIKDRLKARSGDTLTKDTVRSCKNCGAKSLYYAHNSKKVNTYCDGCGVSKHKTSSVAASSSDQAA